MTEVAASIFVACFFAIAGGYLLNGIVKWYDGWDYRRWLKRREAMTLEQRIAEMNIDHSSSD